MKKISVHVETELTIDFDENSKEFQELFENYQKYFSKCDYDEFAERICGIIAKYGADEFIDGVGNIRINGEKQKDYLKDGGYLVIDHPINVIGDFDLNNKCLFDAEISEQ